MDAHLGKNANKIQSTLNMAHHEAEVDRASKSHLPRMYKREQQVRSTHRRHERAPWGHVADAGVLQRGQFGEGLCTSEPDLGLHRCNVRIIE